MLPATLIWAQGTYTQGPSSPARCSQGTEQQQQVLISTQIAVTIQSLTCSEGILLPSLAHIPAQMRSSFMCPAHLIHLWIRPCLLSCVTSTEQGPRKPSQSPKTTTVKVKLGAPSFFSALLPPGEQVPPGPTVAEAQASPANSLQAPGGVGIEVAVE